MPNTHSKWNKLSVSSWKKDFIVPWLFMPDDTPMKFKSCSKTKIASDYFNDLAKCCKG
jgi:hypothetical protein